MSNRIQIRRDSTQNWENTNPTLADGEIALEYDTNRIKVGDGQSNWYGLPYVSSGVGSLATVATSGDYNDLNNRPQTLMDILGGWSSLNDKRFLRLNTYDGQIEYSSDFRVVPMSQVSYPNGTLGQDKVGDTAFGQDGIYYCIAEPNSYTVTWGAPNPWVPEIISLSSIGTGGQPNVGAKLTDGTHSAVVTEVVMWWDGSRTGLRISPEVPAWRSGSGNIFVYTGDAPNTHVWAKLANEIVAAPSTLTSAGIAGQMAYDSSYIYRCVTSSVTEISINYTTTLGDSVNRNSGWTNEMWGNNKLWLAPNSGKPTCQVGQKISDGTNTRTITNVDTSGGRPWGDIITYDGADVDWTAVTSIKVISQEAVAGQWVKAKWFSGSYNDLTDKPVVTAPTTSKGSSGNKAGMVAYTSGYFYYCTTDYTDGVSDIWVRSAWDQTSWS